MSKQNSAEFVVANEGLLNIKNFEYLLVRILNCFWWSLRVVLHLKSPFLIGFRMSFRSIPSISINIKFNFHVILRNFFFADWNKALRKLFLRIGGRFAYKFDKNVSKTNFGNNQLPFFTFHAFFFYKNKAYRSWNLGLTFSISQKLKDLSNIFIYQKNKLVLNKISSIKS